MSENNHAAEVLLSSCCESDKRILEEDELLESKRKKNSHRTDESLLLCRICGQNILDPQTKVFKGLPNAILEEEAALTNDRLILYSEGELIPDIDSKPLHKVTFFTVFDGEGHICSFDSGLIENDQLIFFSGYIKPIYDDDPDPKNGVPAQELGPILEWWISGFDGGDTFLLAFATPYAEYILMEPSPEYRYFMRTPKQKALLTKIVIEFLSNSLKPTYEELLNRINEVSVPPDIEPFDEHSLRNHAQFIIDQIREVDEKKKLISTPAAQEIIKMFKVKVQTISCNKKKLNFTSIVKPTTTPLVLKNFAFFFSKQESSLSNGKHLASEIETFPKFSKEFKKFTWDINSKFAVVENEVISVKDFVFIEANDHKKNRIFRVEYFFQQNFTKKAHCTELIKGTETILGDASNGQEFFFLDECSDWPICKIISKANIVFREPPNTWSDFIKYQPLIVGNSFFVQKRYLQNHGSFEDINDSEDCCGVCSKRMKKEKENIPFYINGKIDGAGITTYDKIIWQNEEYSQGCCVFLEPFSVVFDSQKSSRRIEKTLVTFKADEMIYPEIYRKAKEVNLIEECPKPFVVAFIKKIFSRSVGLQKKLFLTINKFYRPENSRIIEASDKRLFDLQVLYWSEEEAEVSFDHVRGRCNVIYSKIPPDINLSIQFYFNAAFDSEKETFYEIKEITTKLKEKKCVDVKKLKTLNVFSGCGGLAEGLCQSGVADIFWAVEIDKSACKSYKLNFPNVLMFEKDCNFFLKEVMSGKILDENGNRYPVKGEVEFICGGPPCQGFSTMNRFSSKEESQYNNSLILTYLSFCDYYRPKFLLMENVRNFIAFKKSSFLKHTLSCLIEMGYQCTLGVIQAGNFGLPQSRRRLFILAAAPGLALPNFPKPTHVFYDSLKNLEFEVNNLNYSNRTSKMLSGSAPFRKVTIRDAIFDLSQASKISSNLRSRGEKSFYQKFLMGFSYEIQDHVSKELSPINEARIKHIPAAKGCDWRDLPNIRVRLRDGTLTNLLKYSHHDRKNGKSCCGLLRGVCSCATGISCDSKDRQNNTLIPWFLVHTANRNNNWTGLYGRLDWDGVFNTVTTNPEPSSQQGKVLHPEEDRTISVRECARAQGLPDSFKLYGAVAEKFKQVGNAVPSPVARAIGLEIKKSLIFENAAKNVYYS